MSTTKVETERLRPQQPAMGEKQDACTILIFGANGNVGTATVKAIHQYFPRMNVRVAVRDIEKAKEQFTGFSNIEIVYGDTNDLISLQKSLTNVDAVYIITPGNGKDSRSDAVPAYVNAVKNIGTVKFLLFTGCPTTGNEKLIFGREWGKYHQLIKSIGIPFCWLELPFFCENFLSHIDSIKKNKSIYAPIPGHCHFNYISVHDIGLASAYILANCQQHYNKTYTLTGPSTTCYNDIVATLKPMIGDISFYQITKQQAIDNMTQTMNLETWQAEGLCELFDYATHSLDGQDGREITHDFEQITGKKPISYADFLHSIAYAFK